MESNEIQIETVVEQQNPVVHLPADAVPRPTFNFQSLVQALGIFKGQDNKAYAVMQDAGNPYVLTVGSRQLNSVIRHLFHQDGRSLRRTELVEIVDQLKAYAEMYGLKGNVWIRVANMDGVIEIDLGNPNHTRIRISPGKVEVVPQGSETLFLRSITAAPMVMPAEIGNLKSLNKYLNMHISSIPLFIGWLSFTLAHPKDVSTKYPILLLQGNQGTGCIFLPIPSAILI